MNDIAKSLVTVIVTAGFAFGIYSLPGGCWPCCSFFAWFICLAVIWQTGDDENDESDDSETERVK